MTEYIISGELVRELTTFLMRVRNCCGVETQQRAAELMAKLGVGWSDEVRKHYALREHKHKRFMWWR